MGEWKGYHDSFQRCFAIRRRDVQVSEKGLKWNGRHRRLVSADGNLMTQNLNIKNKNATKDLLVVCQPVRLKVQRTQNAERNRDTKDDKSTANVATFKYFGITQTDRN